MTVCPHCHRPYAEPPSNSPIGGGGGQGLRAVCVMRGVWVSHDSRLREGDAASLMGIAEKTLRNWRSSMDPRTPPFVIRARRPLYEVEGIAEYLASAEK